MYNFDFDQDTRAWIDGVCEKLPEKMRFAVEEARKVDFIPYSTENDTWKPVKISWWTNGFWPALNWQMYLATEGYLWEMVQRGNVDMEQMEKGFKKLMNFWKSIYLRKE